MRFVLLQIIECHCPLAELVGFSTIIRQVSSGTATISMEFAFYKVMSEQEKQSALLSMSGLT